MIKIRSMKWCYFYLYLTTAVTAWCFLKLYSKFEVLNEYTDYMYFEAVSKVNRSEGISSDVPGQAYLYTLLARQPWF